MIFKFSLHKIILNEMHDFFLIQKWELPSMNTGLAIHTLKRACTGKLKSIKLALHYEVKRFSSWVNLEGPFFLIVNSIHYRASNLLFKQSSRSSTVFNW